MAIDKWKMANVVLPLQLMGLQPLTLLLSIDIIRRFNGVNLCRCSVMFVPKALSSVVLFHTLITSILASFILTFRVYGLLRTAL
jgi:hypothetical protein